MRRPPCKCGHNWSDHEGQGRRDERFLCRRCPYPECRWYRATKPDGVYRDGIQAQAARSVHQELRAKGAGLMGLRVVEVIDEGDTRPMGCLLWDSVSGLPLPLGLVHDDDAGEHFTAAEMGSAFIDWLDRTDGRDARQLNAGQLGDAWERFVKERA